MKTAAYVESPPSQMVFDGRSNAPVSSGRLRSTTTSVVLIGADTVPHSMNAGRRTRRDTPSATTATDKSSEALMIVSAWVLTPHASA